jgi:hypothetical protein
MNKIQAPTLRAIGYENGYGLTKCGLRGNCKTRGPLPQLPGLELEIFLAIMKEAGFNTEVVASNICSYVHSYRWLRHQHLTMDRSALMVNGRVNKRRITIGICATVCRHDRRSDKWHSGCDDGHDAHNK